MWELEPGSEPSSDMRDGGHNYGFGFKDNCELEECRICRKVEVVVRDREKHSAVASQLCQIRKIIVFLDHDRIGVDDAPGSEDLRQTISVAEHLCEEDFLQWNDKSLLLRFGTALQFWRNNDNRLTAWPSPTLDRYVAEHIEPEEDSPEPNI